jgi:hypothetical protein
MTPRRIRTIRRNPRQAPFPQVNTPTPPPAMIHAEFRRNPAQIPTPTQRPPHPTRPGAQHHGPGQTPR